jgi:hypothetical protein
LQVGLWVQKGDTWGKVRFLCDLHFACPVHCTWDRMHERAGLNDTWQKSLKLSQGSGQGSGMNEGGVWKEVMRFKIFGSAKNEIFCLRRIPSKLQGLFQLRILAEPHDRAIQCQAFPRFGTYQISAITWCGDLELSASRAAALHG